MWQLVLLFLALGVFAAERDKIDASLKNFLSEHKLELTLLAIIVIWLIISKTKKSSKKVIEVKLK